MSFDSSYHATFSKHALVHVAEQLDDKPVGAISTDTAVFRDHGHKYKVLAEPRVLANMALHRSAIHRAECTHCTRVPSVQFQKQYGARAAGARDRAM